jgi:hypothetical protein
VIGPVIGFATGTKAILSAELAAAAAAACGELGFAVCEVASPDDARGVDLLIGIGYPAEYPVLFNESARYLRIAWLGEPLPSVHESLAEVALRRVPMGRVLDAALRIAALGGSHQVPARLSRWREAAAWAYDWRINLRVHREAIRAGIRIVVTSPDREASLARFGIVAPVVPYGYHPVLAGIPCNPASVRDIDVLVLGTSTTGVPTRRARITAATLLRLPPTIRTLVIEDGLWGTDRAALLQRARVVLNIHRVPGNSTGIRSVLAAAAGALVVSEPTDDSRPFVAGVHYVEAEADSLADAVMAQLRDDKGRIAMALAAQHFVLEEVTMRHSIERLIAAVA